MDLHKALNRLAAGLSTDRIDGAHCWQLAGDDSDRPRIAAFMRGLNRTAPLKFDHPGLDTAATRDGDKLLIQNDIGTNDAHVLVIQVDTAAAPQVITLTYSDLHRQRFAFFQRLLAEVGAHWGQAEQRTTQGLNQGDAYHVGTARFEAHDEAELAQQLEGIGERIVFLIDWNRARKRLLHFVSREGAVAVLEASTRARAGHMAWLNAGAERLIWDAMAAQGPSQFRLGDRLDQVLGEAEARDFLAGVLTHDPGMYPKRLILEEARRCGITIMGLDVNVSDEAYRVEKLAVAPRAQQAPRGAESGVISRPEPAAPPSVIPADAGISTTAELAPAGRTAS